MMFGSENCTHCIQAELAYLANEQKRLRLKAKRLLNE